MMKRQPWFFFLMVYCVIAPAAQAGDWPAWRGPNANGVADSAQSPPLVWSDSENVMWKTPVPGRGHSTPIVMGSHIFLTSADKSEEVQSVLCFDRESGKQLWKTEVHRGGFPEKLHKKNTSATPTPACDGERVFATFNNGDGISLTALDLKGKQLWQVRTGDFRSRYPYGYGASPTLYKSLVIVVSEFEKDGFLAAFDRESGKEVWRTPRADASSYSSPIVGKVDGRDQLLISGNNKVAGYDPQTGKPLWSVPGGPLVTAGTVVWENDLVFASGGFPDKETAAIKVSEGGTDAAPLWKNGERSYEQSMLVHDGHLYAVNDNGIAICWRVQDGEEQWKHRLSGPISASPTLANGHIYASVERGITYVFKADPEKFEFVAENMLGNEAFATPVICDGRIYLRVAENSG
ncbi:PQQ-binding-like beta-propeller repeat protein, partial [Verrucomicrobiales bacterium]|nr:PQQ-binding-like beta-propeller repeat protein [Verrucomicrobiales bacterium]